MVALRILNIRNGYLILRLIDNSIDCHWAISNSNIIIRSIKSQTGDGQKTDRVSRA